MKRYWNLIKETVKQVGQDDVNEYAAALAYFTLFSLAPLLLIAIAVAGVIFGQESAKAQLSGQISQMVGPQGAEMVQRMIDQAARPGQGIVASVIAVVTVLLGAMRIFAEIKKMLNRIWGVEEPQGTGIRGFFVQKLMAFVMVLIVGILFLGLIVATSVLTAVANTLSQQVGGIPFIWQIANALASFLIFTLLFALIYKILPDEKIPWSDLWVGAAFTSVLFIIGKYLIGFYLTFSSVASPYGAAGSVVVILLFLYYSALIFFIGAEFTEVYSRQIGSRKASGEAGTHRPSAAGARPGASASESSGERRLEQGLEREERATPSHGRGSLAFGLFSYFIFRKIFHHGGKT